jgi:hypothetical protein
MSAPVVPYGGDLTVASYSLQVRKFTVSGGAGFTKGALGYLYTDGTVRKAINTSEAAAYCRVIALGTIADGASGYFLIAPGIVTISGISGAGVNVLGYVGGTAGVITTTAPTYGTATFLKPVGMFISATEFQFFADPAILPQNMNP